MILIVVISFKLVIYLNVLSFNECRDLLWSHDHRITHRKYPSEAQIQARLFLRDQHSCICILISPLHATDIVHEKQKGWYNLVPVILQFIFIAEWTGTMWSKSVFLKNIIHSPVSQSHDQKPDSLTTELWLCVSVCEIIIITCPFSMLVYVGQLDRSWQAKRMCQASLSAFVGFLK